VFIYGKYKILDHKTIELTFTGSSFNANPKVDNLFIPPPGWQCTLDVMAVLYFDAEPPRAEAMEVPFSITKNELTVAKAKYKRKTE
jgi:hypothetical protein